MVFIKSVFIYPGYAVAQITLIPRPGDSRSIWSARAISAHPVVSGPTDGRAPHNSFTVRQAVDALAYESSLFSVASRPCGVPLSRPSRAIGLTGPCDLYRTEHSSVPLDYSRRRHTLIPSVISALERPDSRSPC